MTDPFNQTLLTLSRAERKQKLIDRYGQDFYDTATGKARTGIEEIMALMGVFGDPTHAALVFASSLQDEHPDEDLTMVIQFVMCAAADMAGTMQATDSVCGHA